MAVFSIAAAKTKAREAAVAKKKRKIEADVDDGREEATEEDGEPLQQHSDAGSSDDEGSESSGDAAEESDAEELPDSDDDDFSEEEEEGNEEEEKDKRKSSAGETTVEFNEPAQWVERMALTSTRPLPADLSADDDPKREEAFLTQTRLSAVRGIELLEAAGVPWRRPADYYAEMVKSDVHMNDVRQAMEASKARIEAQAHRRTMKEQRKYGKEVQAEVLRQRAKYKRDMQDRLSDWKKKNKGNGALRDMLEDKEDDDDDGGRGGSKGQRGGKRSRSEMHRPRNVRPGGPKKRPGKNARRRH